MAADVFERDGSTVISGEKHFDLAQTLDCGQAFRWSPLPDGSWIGAAGNRPLTIRHDGDDIILEGVSLAEYNSYWRTYFDMDRDYDEIISTVSVDDTLKRIAAAGGGIRILRQEPWEALCSFIISQNNNIPRIKGIITRLCDTYGAPLVGGMSSFPDAKTIAALTPEDLAPLRCGFRARYITDAAEKYSSGGINEDLLLHGQIDEARKELEKIVGVGPKVADCTLLFGYGRIEAFPRDVWIKRAMAQLFADGLPKQAEQYAGIVQQYIFQYARTGGLSL